MLQWLQSGDTPFPPSPASCVVLPGDLALGMPGLSLLLEQCGLPSLGPLCPWQGTAFPNSGPCPVKLDLLCAMPCHAFSLLWLPDRDLLFI